MEKSIVVDAVCANLKVPGIGDTIERAAVARAVSAAFDHIPAFVWEIVVDAADGLDADEIDQLLASISRTISARVRMPYLPEFARKQVIDQLLAMLRSTLQVDAFLEKLAK